MSLEDYLFHYVTLIDGSGKLHRGYVDMYISAPDNDDTEESIGLLPFEGAKSGIEFMASDITSIELDGPVRIIADEMIDCPLMGRRIADGYCWELCNIGTDEILLYGDKVDDWNRAFAICKECGRYED